MNNERIIEEYRKEQIFEELSILCDNYNDDELVYMLESLKWLLEERKRQQEELEELENE